MGWAVPGLVLRRDRATGGLGLLLSQPVADKIWGGLCLGLCSEGTELLEDWDYCSPSQWQTRYGVGCAWACAQKGQSYYWCDRTTGGWDYCSDRC